MISIIFTRSGGPPDAALSTSAGSRKNRGPIAAGEMTQSTLASSLPLLSKRWTAPRGMQSGLSRSDVKRLHVDSPGQHAFHAVDRLFVVIVAMRRGREVLGLWDDAFEDRDAAARVLTGHQETHRDGAESDGFLGRVEAETRAFRCRVGGLRQM